jgi:predicted pyridoxine 5'-phosphate oxidase superfamily flavin-nucleotide-binding protein
MAHNYLSTTFTPAVLAEQERYYGKHQHVPPAPGPDELGALEQVFIEGRDSFYLSSVSADGWPYLQHRGGPKGFLKVVDEHTLAFADLGGNRQLLSTGNFQGNDRAALFLMDYPRRQRLKLLGHIEVLPAKEHVALAAEVAPAGIAPRLVERIFRIRVTAHDWNCPKYITPRFTADEIELAAAPLKQRLASLEAALVAAGLPIPPSAP